MEDNATETHHEKAITHNDYLIPIYYKVTSPIEALPNTVATHLDALENYNYVLEFLYGLAQAEINVVMV